MASGDTNLSNNSYKHANFKISDSEGLFLYKGSKVIDSMYMANVPTGYTMGRSGDYGIYYFSKPTPGSKNGSGTEAVSYLPTVSKQSGSYNDGNIEVAIKGNGKIYYTLDGSTPTTSSKEYSSPLTIKKTTVLRIMSKDSGKLKSKVETYSYIVNEVYQKYEEKNEDFQKLIKTFIQRFFLQPKQSKHVQTVLLK